MPIRREVTMPEHILHGCRSTPLASYLKALGILRLISEQCDSTARGSWQDGVFCLSCRMDKEALRARFELLAGLHRLHRGLPFWWSA